MIAHLRPRAGRPTRRRPHRLTWRSSIAAPTPCLPCRARRAAASPPRRRASPPRPATRTRRPFPVGAAGAY